MYAYEDFVAILSIRLLLTPEKKGIACAVVTAM
jgi:hypothetical protein